MFNTRLMQRIVSGVSNGFILRAFHFQNPVGNWQRFSAFETSPTERYLPCDEISNDDISAQMQFHTRQNTNTLFVTLGSFPNDGF